jgi:hypothetical protein
MKWPCSLCCLYVYEYPPLPTLECVNQPSWNLVCISRHLSPHQRRSTWMLPTNLCLYVYPLIVATQRLAKHVPAATNNWWRRRFLCGPCRIKGKQAISSSRSFLFQYVGLQSNIRGKVKVKLSLCFTNEALRHEGVWGSGCIYPYFHDFCTSWW